MARKKCRPVLFTEQCPKGWGKVYVDEDLTCCKPCEPRCTDTGHARVPDQQDDVWPGDGCFGSCRKCSTIVKPTRHYLKESLHACVQCKVCKYYGLAELHPCNDTHNTICGKQLPYTVKTLDVKEISLSDIKGQSFLITVVLSTLAISVLALLAVVLGYRALRKFKNKCRVSDFNRNSEDGEPQDTDHEYAEVSSNANGRVSLSNNVPTERLDTRVPSTPLLDVEPSATPQLHHVDNSSFTEQYTGIQNDGNQYEELPESPDIGRRKPTTALRLSQADSIDSAAEATHDRNDTQAKPLTTETRKTSQEECCEIIHEEEGAAIKRGATKAYSINFWKRS